MPHAQEGQTSPQNWKRCGFYLRSVKIPSIVKRTIRFRNYFSYFVYITSHSSYLHEFWHFIPVWALIYFIQRFLFFLFLFPSVFIITVFGYVFPEPCFSLLLNYLFLSNQVHQFNNLKHSNFCSVFQNHIFCIIKVQYSENVYSICR